MRLLDNDDLDDLEFSDYARDPHDPTFWRIWLSAVIILLAGCLAYFTFNP